MAKPRLCRRLFAAVLLSLALAPVTGARAEYPERPIRLVVPFPPGGVTDIVARLLAERLSAEFGQQVLVDNKTGAGGVIAGDIVAKAPADGYTLLLTTPNHTINAAFRATMPYDTEKDLRAVSNVGQVPMLLVTHPSLPVTTFQGFIDYARKNPGKINVSSAGNGTLPHITMELLMLREKFQVTNVPYRGAAPALADLVAGQVQAKLDNYTQSAQFIADRKLNRARGHQRQAPEAASRRADHGRAAAGLRRLSVDGHRRAGRDTRRRGPEAGGGHPALRRPARDPGALRQGRRRAGRQRTGRVPRPDRQEIAQWRELAKATKITVD